MVTFNLMDRFSCYIRSRRSNSLAKMMSKDMASLLMGHCEMSLDVRHRLCITQDQAIGPNNSWHLPVVQVSNLSKVLRYNLQSCSNCQNVQL